MNRWNICDMVEAHILGFVRKKDNERFAPLEQVVTITRNLNENNGVVILKSENREARFREEFFQPAQRFFRDATLYLGARPGENSGLGHLLIFDLGQGYHAVMTPFVSDEERKKFKKEGG